MAVNRAEFMSIEQFAQYAGVGIVDQISVTCGLRRRQMGRPTAEAIGEIETDVRVFRGRIGVDPR